MRFDKKRIPALRRMAVLCALGSTVLTWAAASGFSPETQLQDSRLGRTSPGAMPRLFAAGFASAPAPEFSARFTPGGKRANSSPTDAAGEGKDHMVDVGGRKLHARVFGQGSPTVVLISGARVLQATWNALAGLLAESATVVTFDRAGYGKSEIGEKPAHARQAAMDLRRLLEELAVPKPYLVVGHSYGDRVARIYASLSPEGLGGLVIMEGTPPGYLKAQQKVLSGADLEMLERMDSARAVPPNPRTEADYNPLSLEQAEAAGPLPRVPCLVLIAGARRENVVPPGFSAEARRNLARLRLEMQKKMAEEIPGGRFIVFEELSHGMHLDNPAPIAGAIKDMIERIRPERAKEE